MAVGLTYLSGHRRWLTCFRTLWIPAMSSTTTYTKLPTPPTRDLSSVLINFGATIFTVGLVAVVWLVMR